MWDSLGSGAGQVFSQLDTRESHLGRGSISGGIAFPSVSKSGAFSRFMVDVGGPSLLWVDSPGQGIWAYTKNEAEQTTGSKPVGSAPPWALLQCLPHLPAHTSLGDGPWSVSISQINPFLLVWIVAHVTEQRHTLGSVSSHTSKGC